MVDGGRRPQPPPPRATVDSGRYWAGAAAVAVVAALAALIGYLVFDRIVGLDLVVPGVQRSQDDAWRLVVLAVIACLLAAALLYALLLTTPRPSAFFGWIVGLATVAAALLPFARSTDLPASAASAVVYLVIGVAIGGLLGSVAGRTARTV